MKHAFINNIISIRTYQVTEQWCRVSDIIIISGSEARIYIQYLNKYIPQNNDATVSSPSNVQECFEKCEPAVSMTIIS